jgi:acyl dehydratase
MTVADLTAATVGDTLKPFVRIADLKNFNRYAAVNDEFVDLHMDDAAAMAKGFPRVIGMGNLTFAWMHCLLREWLGPNGRILSIASEFRTPVLRGDTITCGGVVKERIDGPEGPTYALDIWAENQDGQRLTRASAHVGATSPTDPR